MKTSINLALFNCCCARMCTRISFWTKGERLMGFTIASLSLDGWSLECCPKCVPTNVNPFKLQWNWILLASGKLKRFLEWSRCPKKIVSVWSITTQRHMLLMMAASLFVCLSNLRHVPRTTFKQPSRDCSPWNENSKIMIMWSSSIVISSRNLWIWVILNKRLRRMVCVTTYPITVCSRIAQRPSSVSFSMLAANPRMATR